MLAATLTMGVQARDVTPQRTQRAIDRFVDDSLMRHGSVGVIVADVNTGQPQCQHGLHHSFDHEDGDLGGGS